MPETTTLWYTRCPVPSASGVAIAQRMLTREFTDPGVEWRPITQAPGGSEAHFTHDLAGLFREGGNVPAIAAYAQSRRSVLIGLTFVPELQTIVVPVDSAVESLEGLAGLRFAAPRQQASRVDFYRAMALRGLENALESTGMRATDVEVVDVSRPAAVIGDPTSEGYAAELEALADGRADAAYVKGSLGADVLASGRYRSVWTVDEGSPLSAQINNGTPRAITAERGLVEERPELAARYLAVLTAAASWATDHGGDVVDIVAEETGATAAGVRAAYGDSFGDRLTPSLRPELVEALESQKRFLLRHGLIHEDFQSTDWMDRGPLEAALQFAPAGARDVER